MPGGRFGVASGESRDPIGFAVAAMNRLAQSELLDRVGLRKQAEQTVYTVTRGGFRTATTAGRANRAAPAHTTKTRSIRVMDLTIQGPNRWQTSTGR